MKWIESFVPMDIELVKGSEKAAKESEKAAEGSSKREADKLEQEDAKRIYKEGRKSFFKIIRADGGRLMKAMYLNEVFGYILLINTKLLIKKLKDSEGEHQVYRRIFGIKRLQDDIRVSAAQAVLLANLSSYELHVLSEYLLETHNVVVQDTNSSTQQDAMILFVFEQLSNQCPKPKRKRDATCFRDKYLLVEAPVNGKVLNEEELEFLAGPGITEVLLANLSSYELHVLSE
nr:hypothetical protein [Tanacetum cinerariifolium]